MILATLATLAIVASQPSRPLPPRPYGRFEPMVFLIGHCWEGTIAPGQTDTHCFEAVYNRQFIRDRHEVTGGYRGETLYRWIQTPRVGADYTYWSSTGGVSRGTMQIRSGGLLDFGDETHVARDGQIMRLSTTWRRISDTRYEVRVTSAASPTANRVIQYNRIAPTAIRISQAIAPDGTRSLSHEITIPAPVEQVYAAFATAEGWRTWAVPYAWDVPGSPDLLETSYEPDARLGNPANIRQQFLARVPNRLLVFRTVQFPPGFADAAAYARTTGVAEFEAVGGGTRVRLTGSGYPGGAQGDRLMAFFREGNRATLEQLRARFVTGPVDWAARQRAAAQAD